jgi:hypothetical protein
LLNVITRGKRFKQDMTNWSYMKRVATCLNESQYKVFSKKAQDLGISEYELAKHSLLQTIGQPTEAMKIRLTIIKALKEAYQILDQAP